MAVAVRLNPKILPAALALGLLALGIPQTGDSILWLMTGDTPDQLGAASPHSVTEAERDAALLERANDWFGDSKALIRAGILLMRIATTNPDGTPAASVSKPELDRALDDLTNGLARAPANSIGWTALAQTSLSAGDNQRARTALTTSLLLDDYDPELSLWRCTLGLQLWGSLDENERRMWNDQVNLAWRHNPQDVIALARANGGVNALLIRLPLLSDSTRLSDFDRMLKEQR
jgi:hypothetical protein